MPRLDWLISAVALSYKRFLQNSTFFCKFFCKNCIFGQFDKSTQEIYSKIAKEKITFLSKYMQKILLSSVMQKNAPSV